MISLPFINMIPAGISFESAFGQDIVQMIIHAVPVVKFVLLILFLFSVTSWAIIFMKYRLLRKSKFETISFLDLFWESRDLKKVYMESKALNFSPVARLFRAGYAEFTRFRKLQTTYSDEGQAQAGRQDGRPGDGAQATLEEPSQTRRALMDNLERSLRKATIDQNKRLERSLSFLATTGNTTPFIGLFGTVIGILETFSKLGSQSSASRSVFAPAISEALIATAAGIAVAIFAYTFHLILKRKAYELSSLLASQSEVILSQVNED